MKFIKTLSILLLIPAFALASAWDTSYKQLENSIRTPQFADRTVTITQYGAKTNASAAINQKAINKAIALCSQMGGGKVVVPAGIWNTGAIMLKSHVNLVIEKGATLLFSPDTKLYPLVKTRWEGMDCINYSPLIYAYQQKDIAITGEGVIDGNASNENWWNWCGAPRYGWKEGNECQRTQGRPKLQKWNDDNVPLAKRIEGNGNYLRPQLVNMYQCDGIIISGVTLLRSPFWVIHPLLSQNITVKNVRVINDGPNGDGCDPESCDKVLIDNCYFQTGDDCIAIKSGRNGDGLRWNVPSQNIIIRNCEMADGHGGVVIGSEISGGCKNVYVENCKMDSPNLERVIRIKTNPCRGGITENVFVRNIVVGQCREAVLKINLDYEHNEPSPRLYNPTVRNVYMENVTCQKSQYGVQIIALDTVTNVYNINVKNCLFNGVTSGKNVISGKTRDINYDNLYINGNLSFVTPPFKNYSEWMTVSEMKRTPKSYMLDFAKQPHWSYVMGIELESMLDTYKAYGNKNILDYIAEYPDKMINDNGDILSYNLKDYNLDQIRTGRFIYRINQIIPQKKNEIAVNTLFKQLKGQPRTKEGVWWHKQIYHDQVWLDGIYMGQPFYTMAAPSILKNEKKTNKIYDDAVNQILSTDKRTYDEKTGLWKHAWDETHTMFWANKETGLSQHTWARAQGWYIMAITEVLDALPENYARRGELITLLQKVAKATVKYQDKNTGLWYDVMDVGAAGKGNYLEATSSSMFAYTLLKGYRNGYLDQSMRDAGIKAYNGIINNFIKVNSDSTISLTQCCTVSGLGPESNPRRDGSFEYYISEPIRDNDAKGVGPFIWASLEMEQMNAPIDRKATVSRNNPVINKADELSSLTVGNGKFAATVDITGLQSYPGFFLKGVPLTTMSDWGWHSFKNTLNLKEEEAQKTYDFGHGHPEIYATEFRGTGRQKEASDYFRANPHRLNLGTVGLEIHNAASIIPIDSISDIHQELNLWEGNIQSQFKALGHSVNVTTFVHPKADCLSASVTSLLFNEGKADISLKFSYPSGKHTDDGNDWNSPDKHLSQIVAQGSHFAVIKRTIDDIKYYVRIEWDGAATLSQTSKHIFKLHPSSTELTFNVLYTQNEPLEALPFTEKTALSENTKAWSNYWNEGGIVDFSHCTDIRAKELERRVILSQYLTAVQNAGSMPPQESGLTYNTWFGRPHLEMAWWHNVHFALWGHDSMYQKMLNWYDTAEPKAKAIAQRQGFKGIRWMKMTDPWAGEAPSGVGSFLIWQQPHYIYMAEEMYRADKSCLKHYAKNVEETAEFMADFASYNKTTGKYELKGCTAMQESMAWEISYNQPFELCYWRYGLDIAQKWRERQGLSRNAHWDEIISNMTPIPEDDNKYLAGLPTGTPDSTYYLKCRSDHPAVLGACGLLPYQPLYNMEKMNKTFDWVNGNWNWMTTWGWDYGMMAMTAARLNRPDDAIKALLVDTQKNTYLKNGHNYQDGRLRIYLPGNGALLTTVAMMCAGWDGCTISNNPGWPKNGQWDVRWEGLKRMQ